MRKGHAQPLRPMRAGPSVAGMRNRQRLGLIQTQKLALNSSLQASISILRSDAAGLTRYLEEQARDNPHLNLGPPPVSHDWLPRWSGVFTAQGMGEAAELASAGPSLIAHVMEQIDALDLAPPDQRIALALAEALEPSGWLSGTMEAVARQAGANLPNVEAVLAQLQRLDPAGIFARNLAECLYLQALENDLLSPAMTLILQHLDVLATGDLARLARLAGVDEVEVRDCLREIRAMNPKPGADFAPDSAAFQPAPDLLVMAAGEGWSVALNRSSLPSLRVDATAKGSAAALSAARGVERMIEARNSTLLQVGREVVGRQQEALRRGLIALAPMAMADVAEALGCHESTISRVVAGTSVDTPHGTWWLRMMFSPALGGDGAPIVSGAAMRQHLAEVIGSEPRGTSLSDGELAEALRLKTGVTLARRTVAKYRESLGIPPAHRRKRQKLPPLGTKGRSKG